MNNQIESVLEIVKRASAKLKTIPYDELPAVYSNLNRWEWDERLGKKPVDWDDLEKFHHKRFSYKEDKRTKTKHKIIAPLIASIEYRVSEKALFRYHHVHNLGRTDQQFEDWWDSKLIESLSSKHYR